MRLESSTSLCYVLVKKEIRRIIPQNTVFFEDLYGGRTGRFSNFAGHVDRIADERDLSGDCSMTV